MADKPLHGQVALVTGASRGIGREIAVGLGELGAHVIAVARTKGGLEELDDEIKAGGGNATLVPLDIKDYAGIDRLGAAVFERWKKLDILVGNAGILGKLTPLGHLDPKVWDDTMAVNVTANWRLIRSFDPLLRQAAAGRAVFITSGQAHRCLPYWGTYSISKAALEALVKTYAAELQSSNVKANMFSPGPTATWMRAQAMPGEDPVSIPNARDVARSMLVMCHAHFTDNGATHKYAPTGLYKVA